MRVGGRPEKAGCMCVGRVCVCVWVSEWVLCICGCMLHTSYCTCTYHTCTYTHTKHMYCNTYMQGSHGIALNKGCVGDNKFSSCVLFVERMSFFWRFKMFWNYREIKTNTFGTLKNVLCREVYHIMSLSWRVLYNLLEVLLYIVIAVSITR